MADKQTSSEVSSKAARMLSSGRLFDNPDLRGLVMQLALKLGVSEKAAEDIMLPELNRITDEHMADARSLAASALSQDETPGQSDEG